ncbi:MAG: pilin [Patescibacteria group bacterium]|nr:pilin [Patescibacteria group bacterium]
MRKKIISLFVISLFLVPFLMASPVGASGDPFGLNFVNGTSGGGNSIALGQKDPRTMITEIINVVLTILGIVAVGIVLLGGFKWMTAGGNEDKVSEAKKLLGAGVIGLVIILAAWGIASFVLTELMNATGN